MILLKLYNYLILNKLAKARMTRKSPGTLGLENLGRVSFGSKKFGPNFFNNFLAELNDFKKLNFFFFNFFWLTPPFFPPHGPNSKNPTQTQKIFLLIFSLNWIILRK